jgi:hypothetical protein
MAIWCIMASPLIINYNIFAPEVGTVDPEVVKIVMHDEAIAINQDALGKSAVRIVFSGIRTAAGRVVSLRQTCRWLGPHRRGPLVRHAGAAAAARAQTAWENGEQLAKLALDVKVIPTPPRIFHS